MVIMSEDGRSGTVALMGRPNAGKSTLMNRLLEEKLAIVSDKPQTTRHRLVGIYTEERGQIVFYDTPGLHRPLHRMNRQMVRYALESMNEADVVCLIVDASVPGGSGDAYVLDLLAEAGGTKMALLNKVDVVKKPTLLPRIEKYSSTGLFQDIVPISALTGDGCETVLDLIFTHLPKGPPLYDPELLTVHPERFLAAERIREKLLEATSQELPFTSAVLIDRWEEDEDRPLVKIYASILVERKGQKKIVVGRDGQMVKKIGSQARHDLEAFLEKKVYLELHVRHEANWRESPRVLAGLGYGVV
jgi:GTP-binding protein Era